VKVVSHMIALSLLGPSFYERSRVECLRYICLRLQNTSQEAVKDM
jgi:hypothetical protein